MIVDAQRRRDDRSAQVRGSVLAITQDKGMLVAQGVIVDANDGARSLMPNACVAIPVSQNYPIADTAPSVQCFMVMRGAKSNRERLSD